MKYLLYFLLVPTYSFAQQNPNELFYDKGIITQEIIQNYLGSNEKIVQTKVIGRNVSVIVDTLFNKYTVIYTNEDNKDFGMIFKYVREYFPDKKGSYDKPKGGRSKMYLVEFQDSEYLLVDFLSFFPSNELIISQDELLPNNCTLLFRVKHAEWKSLIRQPNK